MDKSEGAQCRATRGGRPNASPTSVLIVQRNRLTARSFQRYLGRFFGEVRVACSLREAEEILNTDLLITHLVCGDDFGEGEPRGRDLIQRWRRIRPGISRAVLATASELETRGATKWGVDAVFLKPTDPANLLAFLAVS
jgi:DNA-binding response OmpR family regulator